jgi:Flp pilus assembly pilin Flp
MLLAPDPEARRDISELDPHGRSVLRHFQGCGDGRVRPMGRRRQSICGVTAASKLAEVHVTARMHITPKTEQGQTMAEYSLVLTLITIGCITAIALLATGVISAIVRAAGLIP